MNQARITVKIDPLGLATVDATGFEGRNCADATRGIEKALSGNLEADRTFKPEWSNPNTQDQHQHQKIGFD